MMTAQKLQQFVLFICLLFGVIHVKQSSSMSLTFPPLLSRDSKRNLISKRNYNDIMDEVSDIVDEVIEKEKLFLEHVEDVWDSTKTAYFQSSALLKLGYGSILLFFGCLFPSQVYAITMFKAVGLRRIQRSVTDIKENWAEAREVAQEEMPNLTEAKDLLKNVKRDIADIKKVMQNLKKEKELYAQNGDADSHACIEDALRDSRLEMKRLTSEAKRLLVAASSIDLILDALDIEDLFDLGEGIYITFASLVAGATTNPFSANIKAAAYGANIAEALALSMEVIFEPLFSEEGMLYYLPEETVTVLRQGFGSLVYLKSFIFAIFAEQLSSRLNTCVLGASLVVDSALEVKQQFLPEIDVEVRNVVEVEFRAAVLVSLTVAGFLYQGRMMKHGLPKVVERILGPLLQNEKAFVNFCQNTGLVIK